MPEKATIIAAEWAPILLDGVAAAGFEIAGRGRMPPGVNVFVHDSGAEFVQRAEDGRYVETHDGEWLAQTADGLVTIVSADDTSARIVILPQAPKDHADANPT